MLEIQYIVSLKKKKLTKLISKALVAKEIEIIAIVPSLSFNKIPATPRIAITPPVISKAYNEFSAPA